VPITIVATPGASDANSFATLEEADAYLDLRLHADAWVGTEDKKRALITATRELDAMTYQGSRLTDTQALSWPRRGVPDPFPRRLKDATCELAHELLRAGATDLIAPDPLASVVRKRVDVLETEYAHPSQRQQGIARFPRVTTLLGPLLESATGQVRLVR